MAQKGETGLLRNHRELGNRRKGSWPGTGGTRNVRPPEDLPHGMRTQSQSNARCTQTEAEGPALITTLGVTSPTQTAKVWLSVSTY